MSSFFSTIRGHRAFQARISRIASAADSTTRNFEVEVAIPNRDHVLLVQLQLHQQHIHVPRILAEDFWRVEQPGRPCVVSLPWTQWTSIPTCAGGITGRLAMMPRVP